MAEELAKRWPGVVSVTKKYGRPQHHVNYKRFRRPLIKRRDAPDIDPLKLKVIQVGEVGSKEMRAMIGRVEK